MDRNAKSPGTLEMEVVRCMKELLRPLPDLSKRYSSRVIVLAFLTHASAGIRELYARGEFSRLDVERLCKDFRSRVTADAPGRSRSDRTRE